MGIKAARKQVNYLFLFLFLLSLGFTLYEHSGYGKIAATAEEVDRYKVHSELLLKAVEELGVCNPDDAVAVFTKAIKSRNGAMFYSILCDSLKKNYLERLETDSPYWVTGVSSPWVTGTQILKKTQLKNGDYEYELLVTTATGGGPDREFKGELTIQKDGTFYKLCRVLFEKDFSTYTGLALKDTK